jgi:hypothetical protein
MEMEEKGSFGDGGALSGRSPVYAARNDVGSIGTAGKAVQVAEQAFEIDEADRTLAASLRE